MGTFVSDSVPGSRIQTHLINLPLESFKLSFSTLSFVTFLFPLSYTIVVDPTIHSSTHLTWVLTGRLSSDTVGWLTNS